MIAVLCRTPVHVFRTIHMKNVLWNNKDVDIYVFDSFSGAEEVVKRLKKSGLFSRVLYIEDSTFSRNGYFKYTRAVLGTTTLKTELKKRLYDELYTFNIYGIANEIAYNTLKKKNKNLIFNMVEDSPYIFPVVRKITRRNKCIFSLLGLKNAQDNVDFWWFSLPDFIKPFGKGKKKQLPPMCKTDLVFRNIINDIFCFKGNKDFEKAEIIFMEESFYNDGLMKENNDLELFKMLRDVVPDKKCIVKMHPRSKENRFKDDFYVMPSDGIPWEVYALNYSVNKKILVSIGCTTMISSKLLFDDETYSLLVYPILKDKVIDMQTGKSYFTEKWIEKLELQKSVYSDPSKYVIANDVQQAVDTIIAWTKRIASEE